jgi:hypothetical protein
MLPLAHRACWKAGCVLTKVVSPTARPTLEMEASSKKCWGYMGVRNSQVMQAVYRQDVVKRKRCWGRGRGVVWEQGTDRCEMG